MTKTTQDKQPTKASVLRTLWIAIMSLLYTANTCIRSIVRGLLGNSNRGWVDDTLQLWVKRVLKLVGVTCQVYNPHHVMPVPGQHTIVMCNHSSLYDIPLSLLAFPKNSLRMLAKKEMSKIPLMAKGMVAAEFPFIDRHNRREAIKDLAFVEQLLESGIVMWIAPEGTRSKDGRLQPFKKGAFITAIKANAVIIPIGIRGAYDILPARTHHVNLNQRAEVHIGQPIDASKFTLENKEELIEQVYQSISVLIGDQPTLKD